MPVGEPLDTEDVVPRQATRHGRAPQTGRGAGERRHWLYGQHAVAAALANPSRPCYRLVATAPAVERLGALASRAGLELSLADPRTVGRQVSPEAVHQGLALEAGPLPQRTLEATIAGLGAGALLLAVDQVSDPRNLGAILRSAAAFGVAAVLLPLHTSAELGPACAKAASGALDIVPIVEIANLVHALSQLKAAGFWVIGLDADASIGLADVPTYERRVLVLGSEGRGLRRLTGETCDLLAGLPISPAVESLNVAVAAGIALYLLAAPRAGT